jgi:hypothetical protein
MRRARHSQLCLPTAAQTFGIVAVGASGPGRVGARIVARRSSHRRSVSGGTCGSGAIITRSLTRRSSSLAAIRPGSKPNACVRRRLPACSPGWRLRQRSQARSSRARSAQTSADKRTREGVGPLAGVAQELGPSVRRRRLTDRICEIHAANRTVSGAAAPTPSYARRRHQGHARPSSGSCERPASPA